MIFSATMFNFSSDKIMDAIIPMKIKLTRSVVEGMERLAAKLNMTTGEFIQSAVENEIRRCEVSLVREDIALIEIDQNVLADGQDLSISMDEDGPLSSDGSSHCELCLKECKSPVPPYVGPLFCDDCLAVAKGGDFHSLEDGS